MGFYRSLRPAQELILLALPLVLCLLCKWESESSRPWSRITREWASMGLILVGYWSLEWFSRSHLSHLQTTWLKWDQAVLHNAGLKNAIERNGSGLPILLETLYLLLYAIPPACLGVIYCCRARARSDRFLLILFLGTFTTYALLPLFPITSPRVAFPGLDLPSFTSLPRTINTWLLDNMDISTSVFPSGHVAVAFSSAFGVRSVLPHRRWIWSTVFGVAALVYVATIYGRYHYAVDGLASIGIAWLAWRLGERMTNVD